MKDHGPALPRYYCPVCLAPYEPRGQYHGCPSCIAGQKEVTEPVLARAMAMNQPYWAEQVRQDAERRAMMFASGDVCMSDGSICHYDTPSERANLDRINSVHVGKDLRGPVIDEHGNYVER